MDLNQTKRNILKLSQSKAEPLVADHKGTSQSIDEENVKPGTILTMKRSEHVNKPLVFLLRNTQGPSLHPREAV